MILLLQWHKLSIGQYVPFDQFRKKKTSAVAMHLV